MQQPHASAHAQPPHQSWGDHLHSPLVAWSVLAISLALTAWAWIVSERSVQQRARDSFGYEVAEARVAIQRRMQDYEQVLRGGTGLFAASESVSRREWREYFVRLRLAEFFPGIQGYGFTQWVEPQRKAELVDAVRADGFPAFELRPPGERSEYTSIIYLEPFEGRNLRAFGFDMWSEPVRREAMARARDSGMPALSGRVTLVQETQQAPQPGVLLYLPVYRNGLPTATLEERRAALHGFVYSPFRMHDLMRGILGHREAGVAFELHDGSGRGDESRLFRSDQDLAPLPAGYVPSHRHDESIEIAGRRWTLQFHSRPAFDAATASDQPLLIAFGGLVVDLLLFFTIWQLWVERTRAAKLADEATADLRRAEHRARQIVDAAPSAMVMTDGGGRIVLVNAEVQRLFGWSRAELAGEPIERLVPLRTPQMALAKGAARDLHGVRKDGSEFPVDIEVNPIETPDGPMVLTAVIDITERRATQQRIELGLKEKTTLLAEVHHRVKNNLQVISSLLNLQAARAGRGEVQQALATSRARVQAMALIHQFLYEGSNFASIDFGAYVKELVGLLHASSASEAGRIALRVEVEDGVTLDLQRAVPCGLLLNELVGNAFKHAFPGDREGEIRVALRRDDEGRAVLDVSDDGVGLPPDDTGGGTAPRKLGMQLVGLLAQQAQVSLANVRTPRGARFELRFEAAAEAMA